MLVSRKCEMCKGNLGKDHEELRLHSAEGISEYPICRKCADLLDKMAEIVSGKEIKTVGDEEDWDVTDPLGDN